MNSPDAVPGSVPGTSPAHGMFRSIYFLLFVFSLPVFLGVSFWINGTTRSILEKNRRTLEQQSALAVLNRGVLQSRGGPNGIMPGLKALIEEANRTQTDFKFLNAGLYDFSVIESRQYIFKAADLHTTSVLYPLPDALSVSPSELMAYGRPGAPRAPLALHWIPLPSIETPRQLLAVTTQDAMLSTLLQDRLIVFWLAAVPLFVLFYMAICGAVFWTIKKPLRRLEGLLLSETEPIESAAPEEFGDLGDLVDALRIRLRRIETHVARAQSVDPVTGLMSGDRARAAYEEARQATGENLAVFYRANFAKEYVKTFGREYRAAIIRAVAQSLVESLPRSATVYALQDHFFLAFLTEESFQQSYARVQSSFAQKIRPLYQKGQSPKSPRLTVSAAAVSNKSAGYLELSGMLQKLHDEWDSLVNRAAGGWAMMNEDDQWVKGTADSLEGATEEIIPEEPESLKDPAFARKAFIVKLAFMFKFEPKKAAKLFTMGFTRLYTLLDEGALEKIKIYGPEAEAEVGALIEKMRLIPRARLYFTESDFKQVFITDVRMVRKIPRDIAGKWFAAGYRRLEDLADSGVEELRAVDGSVDPADIAAVIENAQAPRG
ncbi:GGDEF domain-containing protein [bacterium]|nr:GGDEF domain-containing protein [bacterium]